jgi:hypothetical protein
MRRMIGVITVLMMSQAAATAEPQQIDLDVPSTTVAATVQINDVRFGGLCGLRSDIAPSPRSATSGHAVYSVTSSARASSIGGISSPSAFAVLRLTTNSNLVDRWIDRSLVW